MTETTDWTARTIPPGETDDTVIQVWQITPHPDGDHTHAVVRSWSDLRRVLNGAAEHYLEDLGEAECRDGVTISVKLVDMPLGEYRALQDRAG